VVKSAFSLLEVVFAIIIMGITMVTLPVMMSSNDKGIDLNLAGEAIFGASAELNQVLSYRWDENSIDETVDVNATGLSRVIETSYNDCNNDANSSRYRLRPGHIVQSLHRECLMKTATSPSSLGSDSGDLDDIDDVSTASKSLFINYTADKDSYKQNYKSSVSVTYSDFGTLLPVGSHDAKLVTVTVIDENNNTVTKLSSYTFNIGEVDIYSKDY